MISNKKLEQLSLEASEEIRENGVDLAEMVDKLRIRLEENHKDLALPPNADDFLLRSLRGSKFDLSKGAKKVSRYFQLLLQLKEYYHRVSSSNIEKLFRDGVLSVSKVRDSKGRTIILYKQEFLPPTPDWLEVVCIGIFILIDYLHRISVDTQRIGFVIIMDLHSFSWTHCRYISPALVMTVAKFTTQAFPGRIKGYHYVRNPAIFSYAMALVIPFLSKKVKSRLHFHGWNFQKTLHQFVEPQSLPKSLSGEIADDEYGDGEIFTKLVAEDGYYADLFRLGYNK